MNRWWIWILLLPFVWGVEINYTLYPSKVIPGEEIGVYITLQGSVQNVEYRTDDQWIDVGDVSGRASFVVYLKVPSTAREDVWFAKIYLRYYENNQWVETPLTVPVPLVREPLNVSLEGTLFPFTKSTLTVILRSSIPLRDVSIYLSPSLEGEKSIVKIDGEERIGFDVLPRCKNGAEDFNVVISGYSEKGMIRVEKRYTIICNSKDVLEIEISGIEDSVIQPGNYNAVINFINNADKPLTITYSIVSNVPLGGKTAETVTLGGRKILKVPISFSVDEEDSVSLQVNVGGDINKSVVFSYEVLKQPSLEVYIKDIKWGELPIVVLEVANRGEGDAKNVMVEVEGFKYFIGTITSNDYDNVEISLYEEKNKLNVVVYYTFRGNERKEDFTVTLPPSKRPSFIPWWFVILIIPLLYLIWRKYHERSRSVRR